MKFYLKRHLVFYFFILLLVFIFIPGVSNSSVYLAQETQDQKIQRLSREIEEYQKEIERLKNQASTLSNQIAQYNAQIKLTSLKIAETEEKIALLGGRITQLQVSLETLNNAFVNRAIRTYKMSKLNEPFVLILFSNDISGSVSSYYYLRRILEADRDLLLRLTNAQETYKEQKSNQEFLQKELEEQKSSLDSQKKAKAFLLEQTRNDEKRYQQLLAAAKAEFEAIQAIIAGKGVEEKVGKVDKGERIASIIQGPSCNSSGEHLHFIVSQGGQTRNPFDYLRAGVDYENCSGSGCGSSDGDLFNPSGNWEWPIAPQIKFTQGYGNTWAIRNTWVGKVYQFHNGIDIVSKTSEEVKAVQAGTLFRGSYTGYNGCRLRYVRVDHDDSDLETFYLHINY